MFLLRVNCRQLNHNTRIYTSNYNQLVDTQFISLCFSFINMPDDTEIEGKKAISLVLFSRHFIENKRDSY